MQLRQPSSATMDKPQIFQSQYAVGQAEYATGHVLKKDKTLLLTDDESKDAFEIFNSYEQAKEFCIKRVQDNPDIECWIYDYIGQVVFGCDKDGERGLTPSIN